MPFTTHIVHAILINLCRLPLYAFLTKARTLPISIGLILFEVSIIPLSIFYDCWSRIKFFSLKQVIMVEDFISMNETPKFSAVTTDIPSSSGFKFLTVKDWRTSIHALIIDEKWVQAAREIQSIRTSILLEQKGSHFLCLHFLESVQLAIENTIKWQELLPKESLKSLYKHRARFIWWQAIGYEGAQVLDWMAFSVHQNMGVPILINDVPSIPV